MGIVGKHYVYTLAYPDSMGGYVFYVGKGVRDRVHHHEQEARRLEHKKVSNAHKVYTIRKIWREGEQVVKTILAYFETHKEACQYEIALIFFMDRLTNITSGGDGVVGVARTEAQRRRQSEAQKGQKHSEETIRRMSAAHAGKIKTEEHLRNIGAALRGRKHSTEVRRKNSEAQKASIHTQEKIRSMNEARRGKPSPKKGMPLSEEHKRKLSNAHKGKPGRKPTEEELHNRSEAQKGRVFSEEHREKLSGSHRGQKLSEEHRKRISEGHKGKIRTPGEKITLALQMYADKSHTVLDICSTVGISPPTLYRYVKKDRQPA